MIPAPTAGVHPWQAPALAMAPQGPDISLAPGAVGDLEAMLPSEANGVKFQKTSFDGASIPGGLPIGEGDDLTKFLADNGKSLSDVNLALAIPVDPSAVGSMVIAIQVKGAPSDKMLAWATMDAAEAEKTTVGGKQVYGSGAAGVGAYFYVKGDVAFYVIAKSGTDLAAAIISQLP